MSISVIQRGLRLGLLVAGNFVPIQISMIPVRELKG